MPVNEVTIIGCCDNKKYCDRMNIEKGVYYTPLNKQIVNYSIRYGFNASRISSVPVSP